MNPHVIALFIIGGLEFSFGVWLITKYVRSPSIISFAIFVFAVAFWVWSNMAFGFNFGTEATNTVFAKSGWFFGVVLTVAFLHFTRYFPYQTDFPRTYHIVMAIVPVIVFFPLIFFTDLIITDQYRLSENIITGQYYFLFMVFFFAYWIAAFWNLIKKYRNSGGIHHWQLKYFLIGSGISWAAATTTDVLLSATSLPFSSYFGSEMSIIWLAFCGWIVVK